MKEVLNRWQERFRDLEPEKKVINETMQGLGIPYHENLEYVYQIAKLADKFGSVELDLFVLLTDVFMLRRLLDKDYITKAIVYTGMKHSSFYIQFLVTQFQFKVTHYSYSSIKSIEELNKYISNITSYKDNYKIFDVFMPSEIRQCSDLSTFPRNFK